MKALILTDGKPGHENQSIALCRHLELDYEIARVFYPWKSAKALSYLLDRLGIYTEKLFRCSRPLTPGDLIVSTGSTTFYPNKVLARKLKLPNVAILYPKGYRLDFTRILCPTYDHPPKRENILELPLNLCAADPGFFANQAAEFKTRHTPHAPAVGFVIGGSNAVSSLNAAELQHQLQQSLELTKGYEHWITTSRRTPADIEAVVEALPFDYKLIHSRNSYNPVPAFIQLCDRLFVTSDSASMISECASFGTASVEILMTRQLKTPNKFQELIGGLETLHAVHVFDGTLGSARCKINLKERLQELLKCI